MVDLGWPIARAAERYDVSWPTAKRWADRYRELGEAGMTDASTRPHRSPHKTPTPVVRKIVHLRWKQRLGPVQIADWVGVAASTVHKILVRCRPNRLCHLDRVAYAEIHNEIHNDETAAAAVAVLRRAVTWLGARGVTVERVLSDNGGAPTPRSHDPHQCPG